MLRQAYSEENWSSKNANGCALVCPGNCAQAGRQSRSAINSAVVSFPAKQEYMSYIACVAVVVPPNEELPGAHPRPAAPGPKPKLPAAPGNKFSQNGIGATWLISVPEFVAFVSMVAAVK